MVIGLVKNQTLRIKNLERDHRQTLSNAHQKSCSSQLSTSRELCPHLSLGLYSQKCLHHDVTFFRTVSTCTKLHLA